MLETDRSNAGLGAAAPWLVEPNGRDAGGRHLPLELVEARSKARVWGGPEAPPAAATCCKAAPARTAPCHCHALQLTVTGQAARTSD